MQQYFIDKMIQIGDTITLDKEQSHHIANVLRMREGEMIRLCDKHEQLFSAYIHFQAKIVQAHVDAAIEDHTRNSVSITLAQGMIKGEKWDYFLQKSAELGVTEIIPFMSSRCVVKAKEDKIERKMERWRKILLEACEQCKRSSLVTLHEPATFANLPETGYDIKLIAYEDADHASDRLCDVLKKHKTIQSIIVVVGSEGGFSKEEVECLEKQGYVRVSLGARILRAETAALSLLSNIAFFYDMERGK